VEKLSTDLPTHFNLAQNYPNPFNTSTTIRFSIPASSYVSLKLYDLLGQEIETLVNERLQAGAFEVNWNAKDFPSGVYICRIQVGDLGQTKKIILHR
jgi:glucuronoarabinoxylan endo-1,4-beta-xylanase